MYSIVEALCLQKYSQRDGAILIKCLPEKFEFCKQKKLYLSCTFPETNQNNTVYSFCFGTFLVFCWTFSIANEIFSISIITKNVLPALFFDFLNGASKALKNKSAEERFDEVNNIISKWQVDPNAKNIKIEFFSGPREISLEAHCTPYDPTLYTNNELILEDIWNSLVTGKGVLIIGNTPEQASQAAYAVLTLIAPYRYSDDVLFYTGLGDPRFLEIINGSTRYKVVATTNALAADRCKQFKTIFKLPPKPITPSPELRQLLQKKINKLFLRTEYQFNKRLEIDPYSDLLDYPLTDSQIGDIVNHMKFSLSDYKLFMNMAFFQDWKRSIILRTQFREAFLSFSPKQVVSNKKSSELRRMEKILNLLSNKYKTDDHMCAVIAEHMKLVQSRISARSSMENLNSV